MVWAQTFQGFLFFITMSYWKIYANLYQCNPFFETESRELQNRRQNHTPRHVRTHARIHLQRHCLTHVQHDLTEASITPQKTSDTSSFLLNQNRAWSVSIERTDVKMTAKNTEESLQETGINFRKPHLKSVQHMYLITEKFHNLIMFINGWFRLFILLNEYFLVSGRLAKYSETRGCYVPQGKW